MNYSNLTPLYSPRRARPSPPPALADDERVRLDEERRRLARERVALDERRATTERAERHAEATAIAADLAHDVDANRPGYTVGLILAATRKARGVDVAEPTGMVADIIRAGKLARGEIADVPALPTHPMAKAIVLAGMRARGEPISAADAAWQEAFCRKLEHDRRR